MNRIPKFGARNFLSEPRMNRARHAARMHSGTYVRYALEGPSRTLRSPLRQYFRSKGTALLDFC